MDYGLETAYKCLHVITV